MTPDEVQVLYAIQTKVGVIESKLDEVLGNGQPGRLARLEAKVRVHDKLVWMGGGIWVAMAFAWEYIKPKLGIR